MCGALGVKEVNRRESIFTAPEAVRPRVKLGCTLEEAFPGDGRGSEPNGSLNAACVYHLYGAEQYVLSWQEGRGLVLLRDEATGASLLRVRGRSKPSNHGL